jgi:hypothetical protein
MRTVQPGVDLDDALRGFLAAFGGGLAQRPFLLGAIEGPGRQGGRRRRFARGFDGAQAKLGLDLLLAGLVGVRLGLGPQSVVLIAMLVRDGGRDAAWIGAIRAAGCGIGLGQDGRRGGPGRLRSGRERVCVSWIGLRRLIVLKQTLGHNP